MKIDIASKWIKDNIVGITKYLIEKSDDKDAKSIHKLLGYTAIDFEITQHNNYRDGKWQREYSCIIFLWYDNRIYYSQFIFYRLTMKEINERFKQIENEIQQENSQNNNIAPVDN